MKKPPPPPPSQKKSERKATRGGGPESPGLPPSDELLEPLNKASEVSLGQHDYDFFFFFVSLLAWSLAAMARAIYLAETNKG